MQERDFSQRRNFPGTTGNTFDTLLHAAVVIEKTPALLFALSLLVLSLVPQPLDWLLVLVRWAFSLCDWGLVAVLPHYQKSFGPAKPPVLVLGLLRTLVALFPPIVSLPLQVVGTLLVVYGFWIEPHHLGLTKESLHSARLKPGAAIRILHIGDLHVERITHREQQINRYIQDLEPDLILFSGDFLNLSYRKDPLAREAARSLIKEWQAPYGTFIVTGSPVVDLPEVIPGLLEGLPVHWLHDERQPLNVHGQEIDLIGLSCSHKPFVDRLHLEALLPEKPEKFTLLLYHSPDLSPSAAQAGVDLQLSGHTHGGQVRLPFIGALFTGSLYGRRFQMGRQQIGEMTLYITRGIGMEGASAPRVRFLCPPEVILWEISG
jgi:predicted MPP superfamily phosphohydrolase